MDFEHVIEKLEGRGSGLIEIRKHSCVLIPFVEREGLAVPPERILYTHEYDTLIHYANMAIHTVVGQLDPQVLEEIRPAEDEVAEWFTIPVDWLAEHEPLIYEYRVLPEIRDDFPYDLIESPDKYNWRTGKWHIPVWNYEGHCLWGMTARIVYALLKFLA